jgi:hypothetical protein
MRRPCSLHVQSEEAQDLPRSSDRSPTDRRMAAVHALGHPGSPAPRTAWGPSGSAHGGGSTAPACSAAAARLPPNAPGAPVLAQGIGSDLIVTWTAPAVDPAHGAATGFALRHGRSGGETWTVVQRVSDPHQLSDLPSAAAVDVQLQATNAAGLSRWSDVATLTTGLTGPVVSGAPPPPCPPAEKAAATAPRMLPGRRCRIAVLTQLLCRLDRRLRTYLLRFARLLHLPRAHRGGRRNL